MESKQISRSRSESIALGGGILSILLGLTIISAWILKLDTILQIDPLYTPMVFNTAFSFLLCGIAIVLYGRRIRLAPEICGALVFGLALTTLIQYIFNIDLGIDKLVIDPYITTKNPFPGRMAPNTTCGFLAAGLALVFLGSSNQSRSKKLIVSLIGASTISMGLVVLIGYLVGFEAIYGWGDFSRMAPSTASGFILCGTSLFCYSMIREKRSAKASPTWLPVPVGFAIAVVAVTMWHAMASNEQTKLLDETEDEARNIKNLLAESLNNQVNGLVRMAKRWEISKGTTRAEWTEDALWYVKHRKGCQGLYRVNSDLVVQWVVPSESQNLVVGRPAPSIASSEIKERLKSPNKEPLILPISDLPHGGTGFIVSIPITVEGRFAGLIQGEYEFQSYLLPIFQNYQDLSISLEVQSVDGQKTNFRAANSPNESPFLASSELEFAEATWVITARPTLELVKQFRTVLPQSALVIGLINAILFSLLVHFFQKTKSKTAEMFELNRSLEMKVEERTKELTERDAFTRQWLSNCTDGAWYWDLAENKVHMTSQFKSMLGYKDDEIDDNVDNWRKLIPPVDLQVADKAYLDYINEGKRYAYQLRWLHKDGTVIWTLCRGQGIKDDTGEIVQMVGTLTDISKLKQLEEELTQWAEVLEKKNSDLERFNRLAVGREKRVIELKAKVNELYREMGRPEPYNLNFKNQLESVGTANGK